ncbi:hypothetical protein H6F86_20955 [Phormidium sp. FACHB-592]|uniref:Transposase n=1 Tax=Stenomitos frigidus AS-A4 TaxID=2933935 RepID=A0ABV0KEN2_9CYAN|nr:hypothetical protein [Phormidium sp. FACHB-592]MBD2076304.1 hypothetical protein [Phormidium sp. FACHB-592]
MIDLELQQRDFPAAFAKTYAIKIYGSKPSPNTWRNWRSWADIPKGAKLFSFEQVCKLTAIAVLRSKNAEGCLRESDIHAIAYSLEHQEQVAAVIEYLDNSEIVAGNDLVRALSVRGVDMSLPTLYRRMREINVKFSQQKTYKVNRLVTFLR